MPKDKVSKLAHDVAKKYAAERRPYSLDRGREVVFIRREIQTVKIMLSTLQTCYTCAYDGKKLHGVPGVGVLCDGCYEAYMKNYILYEL